MQPLPWSHTHRTAWGILLLSDSMYALQWGVRLVDTSDADLVSTHHMAINTAFLMYAATHME
jgi:hypothetical protein